MSENLIQQRAENERRRLLQPVTVTEPGQAGSVDTLRAGFENNQAFIARETDLRNRGYGDDEILEIMDREF